MIYVHYKLRLILEKIIPFKETFYFLSLYTEFLICDKNGIKQTKLIAIVQFNYY